MGSSGDTTVTVEYRPSRRMARRAFLEKQRMKRGVALGVVDGTLRSPHEARLAAAVFPHAVHSLESTKLPKGVEHRVAREQPAKEAPQKMPPFEAPKDRDGVDELRDLKLQVASLRTAVDAARRETERLRTEVSSERNDFARATDQSLREHAERLAAEATRERRQLEERLRSEFVCVTDSLRAELQSIRAVASEQSHRDMSLEDLAFAPEKASRQGGGGGGLDELDRILEQQAELKRTLAARSQDHSETLALLETEIFAVHREHARLEHLKSTLQHRVRQARLGGRRKILYY